MSKPFLRVTGQFGLGDCLHQRAVVRELMKTHRVELHSYYTAMYHDLVGKGLDLKLRSGHEPRIRDAGNDCRISGSVAAGKRIGYTPELIRQYGSILAAQFASIGLKMPERPDFSLPMPAEWRRVARKAIEGKNPTGKPLMVYRPIILNSTWEAPARSPDPNAYDELYRSIRDRFFVVSICNLNQKGERIVGPKADVDVEFHRGELEFEALAGLIAEADLVFGNAGFVPVLSQAVGTPVICIYGANESFRTTNQPGAHLAPTLAIEPITPCEHHARTCSCDKTIDMEKALPKVEAFADEHGQAKPRILIFGTTYVDTPHRQRLTQQWADLHRHLNPGCNFLLVDSASPLALLEKAEGVEVFSFSDNIGHLSRNGPNGPSSSGRDGWGRAFCKGLDLAVGRGYDFAVHIEGDSLFRLPVGPIVRDMKRGGTKVSSVPVEGTKRKEVGWVETGLMFFDCRFLAESDFVRRYDWDKQTGRPTPEKVIFNLFGRDLKMMPWKAERGDKSQITVANVTDLDWVTHCHDRPEIYDRYVEAAMGTAERKASTVPEKSVRLNFGCGTNKLDGWRNFDADVDITKRLPFGGASADLIFAEHVVEHVGYYQALDFFKECRRVLRPGGVVRITVPSIENLWKRGEQDYFDFARKWAPSADLRGAMHAILFRHGHKAAWTQSLLEASLIYVGFDTVKSFDPGQSGRDELRGVEGHGKVIGDRFNWVESVACEAW